MISLLFDIMGACAHFMWNALGAVFGLGMRLLSAVATVLSWPFKAAHGLLSGALRWTPLFLAACGVLAVLVLGITAWAAYSNYRRKTK